MRRRDFATFKDNGKREDMLSLITYDKIPCSRWDEAELLKQIESFEKNQGKEVLINFLTSIINSKIS